MTSAERQRRYAATRPRLPDAPKRIDVRIIDHDGRERVEQHASLEAAARAYPGAVRIERADVTGFW
ncbi:MAG: hypothetical protein IT462_11925 [Planctomycetes bacterium]|nr:hypothetical protein [Planctomycetota bacterium]